VQGLDPSSEEMSEKRAEPGSHGTVTKITRLVFIDKENACDCTRKRCDKVWSALQGALDSLTVKPEVQRFYIDTQEELVAPYQAKRPILAAPALYFFEQDGSLAGMLQGEIEGGEIMSLLH